MSLNLRRQNQRLPLLRIMFLFGAALGSAQLPTHLERGLIDLSSADLSIRSKGLSTLLKPHAGENGWNVFAAVELTRAYPDQSERIKSALITALEKEAAEIERLRDRDEGLTETRTEYWFELGMAVASLRDPRAARALLAAGGPQGDAMTFFADLCPDVIDLILERSKKPPRYWRGMLVEHPRGGGMVLLGRCLTRVASMRSAPDALAKARKELLAGLDDPSPLIRKTAADALRPLRHDPQVRSKLESLAQTDPYVDSIGPAAAPQALNGPRFTVRDAANRALDGPDPNEFYIFRDPGTMACHVGPAADNAPEVFIGPIRGVEEARSQLCLHYDPTPTTTGLCRSVAPENSCRKPSR